MPERTIPSPQETAEFRPFLEQKSVWASLKEELRARFHPEELPPLELESKPVPVEDIWSHDNKRSTLSRAGSLGLHVAIIAALIYLGFSSRVRTYVTNNLPIVPISFSPYQPVVQVAKHGGGGGGGTRDLVPPSRGRLPRQTMQVIAPPEVKVVNIKPILPAPQAVMVPPTVHFQQPNLPQFGDPAAVGTVPSNGTGTGGGIGTGFGGGVGPGSGKGIGPGNGWGTGGGEGGVAGITPPQAIYSPDPEYSEEARKAKFQGTVVLWVMIGADGRVHDIKLKSPVGLGLDQKAIDAVKTWRFEPARKNGQPLDVASLIEVNFRLY
jgi:TonB family protein